MGPDLLPAFYTVAGNRVRYLVAKGPGDCYGPWLSRSQPMEAGMSLSLFSWGHEVALPLGFWVDAMREEPVSHCDR